MELGDNKLPNQITPNFTFSLEDQLYCIQKVYPESLQLNVIKDDK